MWQCCKAMVNNSLTTKRAPGAGAGAPAPERRLQRKRTIGPTCGPLGPGEAPSFAPTVSERRPLPDANRVIWLDNFGRLLGGNNGRATDRLDRSHHHWRNAGWLAEQFMKSQMGLVMNIVLGIIGAAVASWLFGFLGITFGGWLGYLIAGFIGACILIAIVRAFSGGLQQRT